jgi:hypothetical protein
MYVIYENDEFELPIHYVSSTRKAASVLNCSQPYVIKMIHQDLAFKGLKIEKIKGEKEDMRKTIYAVSVNGQMVGSGKLYGSNGDATHLSDEYGDSTFKVLCEAEALYESQKQDDLDLIPEDPNYLFGHENVEVVSLERLEFDENGEIEDNVHLASYIRFLDPLTT